MPPENVDTRRRAVPQADHLEHLLRALRDDGAGHAVELAVEAQLRSAERYVSSVWSWNTRPMLRRTAARSRTTSKPATLASPAVGFASVQRILIVVDLPAPFGPRNPNVSPACTARSRPRTASTSP